MSEGDTKPLMSPKTAEADGTTAVDTYMSPSEQVPPPGGAVSSAATDAQASSLSVRVKYGVFLVFGFVFALLLRDRTVQWITKWEIENKTGCTDAACVGDQGAYRISFALFIFFLIHWIVSSKWNLCMEPATRVSFNNSSMLWKLVVFVPLVIISFTIPNSFFVSYAYVSIVLSVFFLIAQLIILIDFSYKWSDAWANREETRYKVGLVIAMATLYVVSLVFIGLMYKWFGSESQCQTGQTMVSITLIAAIIYTFICIMVKHGSVIPSGTVFIYTVWTCYSALNSGIEHGPCNTLNTSGTTLMIIGISITVLSLVYAATNAGASRDAFQLSPEDGDDDQARESAHFSFFHLMMMLAACYMAMLLTNWSIHGSNNDMLKTDSGKGPMWAKIVTEVVCILMYIWTLVAPSILKDREFE